MKKIIIILLLLLNITVYCQDLGDSKSTLISSMGKPHDIMTEENEIWYLYYYNDFLESYKLLDNKIVMICWTYKSPKIYNIQIKLFQDYGFIFDKEYTDGFTLKSIFHGEEVYVHMDKSGLISLFYYKI